MSVAINGTDGITFNDGSLQPSAPVGRNLIINGNMMIDQRGGTVTINTASRTYGVDRWLGYGQASDGVFTIVQDTEAPAGFVNSTKITTTTADASIGASQYYLLGQSIEGTNFSPLVWGSASAKTVTLSFWVRSSLTGTFGGAINNNAVNRSYPFTYTIDSANTWEQKSVTITGDTSGTWLTTTGIGANVWFDLGCGSSNVGTAGTWAGAGYYGATGTTSLIGTNGATLYITGVQLEANTTATPFENLQYTTQLQLCQRYAVMFANSTSGKSGITMLGSKGHIGFGLAHNTGNPLVYSELPVLMRALPTQTYSNVSHFIFDRGWAAAATLTALSIQGLRSSTKSIALIGTTTGLNNGDAGSFDFDNTDGWLLLDAEL